MILGQLSLGARQTKNAPLVMMVKNSLIINIKIINHFHLKDNSRPGLCEGYDGQHQHQHHLEDNG